MKVKDIIEKLKEMPQDKEIYFYEEDYPVAIYEVFIDKDGDVGMKF